MNVLSSMQVLHLLTKHNHTISGPRMNLKSKEKKKVSILLTV